MVQGSGALSYLSFDEDEFAEIRNEMDEELAAVRLDRI